MGKGARFVELAIKKPLLGLSTVLFYGMLAVIIIMAFQEGCSVDGGGGSVDPDGVGYDTGS